MATNAAAEATANRDAATAKKTPARKPATAKAPQDHKPADTAKEEATGVEVLTVTVRDREWTIARDSLGDFELLEHLDNMERGGTPGVMSSPKVLRAMLGAQQMREAMALLRNTDTGRVDINDGYEFVSDLMGAFNPNS